MYHGKDCVEMFEDEVKYTIFRLFTIFPQQAMTELIDMFKREHKAAEKFHICVKKFHDPENREVRDHCHYKGLHREASHNNCNIKY